MQTRILAPQEILGFVPGDDRKARQLGRGYPLLQKLDETSDRVKFETLGKSTMGQPFVMATISAPENLARLDEYKNVYRSSLLTRASSAPRAWSRPQSSGTNQTR